MLFVPKANHRKMIDECYPPPKTLASIGPEYKANSNELGKLAYYANRKPEKLVKVGKALELRVSAEAKAVGGSGQAADKAKGALMVTLAITNELITECHRDVNYFASSAAHVLDAALQSAARANAGRRDLDITARCAAGFYALANYLHSASNPVDSDTTRQYLSLVGQFARIAMESSNDVEVRNRTRLIGLGALSGAIASDAFYTPSYTQQLSLILPSLLGNVGPQGFNVAELKQEADKIADGGTPSKSEFAAQRKPVNSRSVPNFSTDGDRAPSEDDVISVAMGNMHAIVHNGDASHVQAFVAALIAYFNGKSSAGRQWANQEWCCWITQAVSSWTAQQYRFIVPTNIVDYLADDVDGPTEDKHHTLVAIVHTLLGGRLSMIGLSTSDTANNLLGYAVRRVHQNVKDPLLPLLVAAIGSLGTHIYYADQLNDLAEEIVARIAASELPMAAAQDGAATPYTDSREAKESIRMLLGCLVKLITTAQQSNGQVTSGSIQTGARSRISPSVFHLTASLLASPDNWVRQSFEETLVVFLKSEVQQVSLLEDDPMADKLGSKLSIEATGFTHSFSAALYCLMICKVLYAPTAHRDGPLEALPVIDRSNKERDLPNTSSKATALPIDIAAVIKIIDDLVDRMPVATILGLVPALLAINKASASLPAARQGAVNTVLKCAFNKIGSACGVSSLQNSVSLDKLPLFPPSAQYRTQSLEEVGFDGKGASPLKADSIISALANSGRLQKATDLDVRALQHWFGRDWSVQIAVDDSYVGASPFTSTGEEQSATTARFPSPAINRIASFQKQPRRSQATTASQADTVGVDDFRQALGARSYARTSYSAIGKGTPAVPNGSAGDGGLTNGGSSTLDKRASRRASRKISQPVKLGDVMQGNGTVNSVGGLLDSMRVGLPEPAATQTNGHKAMPAPYVP